MKKVTLVILVLITLASCSRKESFEFGGGRFGGAGAGMEYVVVNK